MIKTEMLRNDTLIKHYSDLGVMLKQEETGMLYADPVEIYPCPFTYTETDIPIEEEEEVSEEQIKAQAYDIIIGVSE